MFVWVGVAGRWHGSVNVWVGGGAGRLVSMGGWASECVGASILLVLLFGIMGADGHEGCLQLKLVHRLLRSL